jgi:hypothetical protein
MQYATSDHSSLIAQEKTRKMSDAIDKKSYFYLSQFQKTVISIVLIFAVLVSFGLIYVGKFVYLDDDVKALGIDFAKTSLAAVAVWCFLAVYGSSNSKTRILKEIYIFLNKDLPSTLNLYTENHEGDDALDPLNSGLTIKKLISTKNSVTYEFSRKGQPHSIYLHCRFTLSEVITIFFLPAEFEDNWATIYADAIKVFEENSVRFSKIGVLEAGWLQNDTPSSKLFKLEIRVTRPIPFGFLFDAAGRMDICEKIIGDCRAFLNYTIFEKEKQPAQLAIAQV